MVGFSVKVCCRKCKCLVFLIFLFRIGVVKEDFGVWKVFVVILVYF